MLLILIFPTLFKLLFMYHVDLANQTSECVEWIQNHVYDNTELHSVLSNTADVCINFEHLDELNGMGCKNLKIETGVLSLNAKRKILIENNVNFTELLSLINFNIPNEIRSIQISNILGFNQYFFHE